MNAPRVVSALDAEQRARLTPELLDAPADESPLAFYGQLLKAKDDVIDGYRDEAATCRGRLKSSLASWRYQIGVLWRHRRCGPEIRIALKEAIRQARTSKATLAEYRGL